MELKIDGEDWFIDAALLQVEVSFDSYKLVTISKHGELVLDDENIPGHREVWQARPEGYATGCHWAGMDFEFCRSFMCEVDNAR